jgi:hypothetical protein
MRLRLSGSDCRAPQGRGPPVTKEAEKGGGEEGGRGLPSCPPRTCYSGCRVRSLPRFTSFCFSSCTQLRMSFTGFFFLVVYSTVPLDAPFFFFRFSCIVSCCVCLAVLLEVHRGRREKHEGRGGRACFVDKNGAPLPLLNPARSFVILFLLVCLCGGGGVDVLLLLFCSSVATDAEATFLGKVHIYIYWSTFFFFSPSPPANANLTLSDTRAQAGKMGVLLSSIAVRQSCRVFRVRVSFCC